MDTFYAAFVMFIGILDSMCNDIVGNKRYAKLSPGDVVVWLTEDREEKFTILSEEKFKMVGDPFDAVGVYYYDAEVDGVAQFICYPREGQTAYRNASNSKVRV